MKKYTIDTNIIQGTGDLSCIHIVMWNMVTLVFEAAHYFQEDVESNNLIRQSMIRLLFAEICGVVLRRFCSCHGKTLPKTVNFLKL